MIKDSWARIWTRLGTETPPRDYQGGEKKRQTSERVGLPDRRRSQEPSASTRSHRKASEQDEGLQETNRGGRRNRVS